MLKNVEDFKVAARRILSSVASEVIVKPSLSLGISTKTPKQEFNNIYGILPFAMTATRDELVVAIESYELAKYKLTELGDFYNAWRAGHRQRILMGVLSGMIKFNIKRL